MWAVRGGGEGGVVVGKGFGGGELGTAGKGNVVVGEALFGQGERRDDKDGAVAEAEEHDGAVTGREAGEGAVERLLEEVKVAKDG